MAKAELSLIEERDENQRALGCVGLSAFAHVGLLIAILFAPSLRESVGLANGSKAGIELPGESITNAAPAGVSLEATGSSAPVEVMLADANDPSAVALPNTPPTQPVVAKKSVQPKAAKPATETEISSALSQARTDAAKAPAKLKAAIPAQQAIETSDVSDVTTPVAQVDESASQPQDSEEVQPAAQAQQQEEEQEEAVPLQVALPEEESLTQAQANALQAPSAKVQPAEDEIPADAKPLETIQSVRSNSAPTGAIITRPANAAPTTTMNQPATSGAVGTGTTTTGPARGLPNSSGATGSQGTVSGTTQSRGGSAGIGVPAGAQVRDARSLEAMPGNPLATYPLPDRLANRQGTTVLLGHVRNDGRIENITLEKSSGSRMMDESAAKAFSQWKYKPGQEGYVRLPMQFKLVGDAHIIPAELNRQ